MLQNSRDFLQIYSNSLRDPAAQLRRTAVKALWDRPARQQAATPKPLRDCAAEGTRRVRALARQTLYLSDRLTIVRQATILKHVLNNVLDPELGLDRVFHALADPGRRRMLERLSQGPASVSELGKPLAMSLAAVLQHVQVLEGSGLVQSRKTGRTRTCSLNPQTLRSAESWISERRTFVERQLDRLGEYLASTADHPDSGAAGPAAPHAPA